MFKNKLEQHSFFQSSKNVLSLGLPMLLTQLITVASGFIAMLLLADLGQEVLAASALIFSSRISILIIGSSLLFALSILIGHALGEKNYNGVGNFVRQGWIFGFLISLPIMLVFYNMNGILLALGQTPAIARINQEFFSAYIWGVIPFLLSITNQQLCYGIQKPRVDFLANLLGLIVLLFFSFAFIFGKWGFPNLGVKGLGYAFALQGWTYFIFTLWYIFARKSFLKFQLFDWTKNQWEYFSKILSLGWPISLQISGEMLSFFAISAMVGWLGTHALAAYQVVTQYMFLAIIPMFAVSQASGVIVGQLVGSRKIFQIKKIIYSSLLLAVILGGIFGIPFLLMPKELAALYFDINNPDNAVTLNYVTILFLIITFSQMFDGVRNILIGALRGLFDTRFPMFSGLFILWFIGIPLGYLLGFTFKMGVAGVALGSGLSMLLSAVILIFRTRKTLKKYETS